MLAFEHESARNQVGVLGALPVAISRDALGNECTWTMPDGSVHSSVCISCATQPCMKVDEKEQIIDSLIDFSADGNRLVCPVDAIEWNTKSEIPEIDVTVCIGCGLCAARCPVGALAVDQGIAHLAKAEPSNDTTKLVPINETTLALQESQLSNMPSIDFVFPILEDKAILEVYANLNSLSETQTNTFARATLNSLGAKAALSRQGDVHTRSDGIYSTIDNTFGPIEIEFGADSLDAVRAALDDIAVIRNRHDIPVNEQEALVIVRFLPRERQGYWQVVSDISNILDLSIHTTTLGALLLLAWNGKKLNRQRVESLTPKFEETSIRKAIEITLGRKITIPLGASGILEPEK